jgi:hypothetical protein
VAGNEGRVFAKAHTHTAGAKSVEARTERTNAAKLKRARLGG